MPKIDHTPTTEAVRLAYAAQYARTVEYYEEGFAEFDRWLKAYTDRVVAGVRATYLEMQHESELFDRRG